MFYTILPQWPLIKPKFKRIARFAPLIGIFIGFLQSFSWLLLKYFNWPYISSALISISISILVTGGLHIDGLMDTADGIGAGPSKRIEAMKDSRVGSIGVQSLIIVMILQLAAVVKLDYQTFFAFPLAAFWGRVSQIFAIENYDYIFKKQSDSFHHKNWKGISNEIRPSLFVIAAVTILFLFFARINIFNTLLILSYCVLSGLLASISIPKLINKLLGGHSGDSYGASLVITETTYLLLLTIILVPN